MRFNGSPSDYVSRMSNAYSLHYNKSNKILNKVIPYNKYTDM